MVPWLRFTTGMLASTLLLVACGLRQPVTGSVVLSGEDLGKPVTRFPTKERLAAELHHPPSTAESNPTPGVYVHRWTMTTTPPVPGANYPEETPWDRVVTSTLADKTITASPELRCAATELARAVVEYGALPQEPLRQFLVLRCGSSLVDTDLAFLYSDVTGVVSAQQVLQHLGAQLNQMLESAIATSPSDLALGYFKGPKRVAFTLLVGRARGKFESPPQGLENGQLELSGTLPSDAAYVMGLANQGAYGVRRCELNRAVPLPRFAMRCPISEKDPYTTVEIATRRGTSMLWQPVLRRFVTRQPDAGLTYEGGADDSATTNSSQDFSEALHRAINEKRQEAGFPEVALLSEQSRSNQLIVRRLYDAVRTRNEDQAQTIALGLLAGWDVPGDIRDGGIYWASFVPVDSASHWRDAAIASPLGRYQLLNPTMTQLAIGATRLSPSGMMAVVTTYELFDQDTTERDEDVVFRELRALRQARGLGEPHRITRSKVLGDALAKVRNRTLSVENAVTTVMQSGQSPTEGPIRVWAIETKSLYEFALPEGLTRPSLECEVGATHYKPEGAAWGQYVIVFVVHAPRTQQARARTTLGRSG